MGKPVSVAARFWGFAGGHLVVSTLGAVIFWVTVMTGGVHWPLALLMLLYVPAGYVAARLGDWGRPGLREGALAVLLPAGAAWLWAFGGWAMMAGGDRSLGEVGVVLLLSTALLASPSFVFMFLILTGGGAGPFFYMPVWYGAMVLAGLLPPLLFFAGTVLPGGRTVYKIQ